MRKEVGPPYFYDSPHPKRPMRRSQQYVPCLRLCIQSFAHAFVHADPLA